MAKEDPLAGNDEVGMPVTAPSLVKHYRDFVIWALGILVLLVLLGGWPTYRYGGEAGLAAMAVGCAISAIAAVLGTLPIVLARGRSAADTVPAVMGSIATRMMAAIMLVVLAAMADELDTSPLILWLVISHAGLLIADIRFAQRVLYIGPKG